MVERDDWSAWSARRAELARAGVGEVELDELEDHLRCEFDALLEEGVAHEVALRIALERLGATASLAAEFRKAHPPMNLLVKLLSVLSALAVVLCSIGGVADLASLVDVPALLLVVGFVAGGSSACFGPRRVLRACAVGLGLKARPTEDELAQLDGVALRGQRLSWAAGVIGLLAGMISTAIHLGDPAEIGPGIGMALMSLLYGALLAELGFGSLRAWLSSRIEPATQTSR